MLNILLPNQMDFLFTHGELQYEQFCSLRSNSLLLITPRYNIYICEKYEIKITHT